MIDSEFSWGGKTRGTKSSFELELVEHNIGYVGFVSRHYTGFANETLALTVLFTVYT